MRNLIYLVIACLAMKNHVMASDMMKWDVVEASAGIELIKKEFETVCSGVFLTPGVVLTTAHCLIDLKKASVTNDFSLKTGGHFFKVGGRFNRRRFTQNLKATHWVPHPGYRGNVIGDSIDIGLIFLEEEVTDIDAFPEFAIPQKDQPFFRVGYGLRSRENRRTLVRSKYFSETGSYYCVRDSAGYPGDSGGPVFQLIRGELKLVGIHTGRKTNEENEVEDFSYIQLIDQPLITDWITRQLAESYFSKAN